MTRAILPVVLLCALSACAANTGLSDPSLVSQLVPAKPEGDGVCAAPATTAGGQVWYQTVCPKGMTKDFYASLQRALEVRGDYTGRITGRRDKATIAAITRYQTARGLPSSEVSYRMAQQLGLVPWIVEAEKGAP